MLCFYIREIFCTLTPRFDPRTLLFVVRESGWLQSCFRKVMSVTTLFCYPDIMMKYSTKWVKDPLHWWSRTYEYAFHAHYISMEIREIRLRHPIRPLQLLDAGAGTDFISWYLLSNQTNNVRVTAVDFDSLNENCHANINSNYGGSRFGFSDNEKLNKMCKTAVLTSNLWSILCFSRWCLLCGKLGLDLLNTLRRSTGAIWMFTTRCFPWYSISTFESQI
jgi:hypothetical protein